MEVLLALLGMAFVIWQIAGPILVFNLSSRLHELEKRFTRQQRDLERLSPGAAPHLKRPLAGADDSTESPLPEAGSLPAPEASSQASTTGALAAASALRSAARRAGNVQMPGTAPGPTTRDGAVARPLGIEPSAETGLAETSAPSAAGDLELDASPSAPPAAEPDPFDDVPASVGATLSPSAATLVGASGSLAAAAASRNSSLGAAADAAAADAREAPRSWEERVASQWMTWVGAIAVLIGVGFFFKYTIDQGWLGPGVRVLLGFAGGLATLIGGGYALKKVYRVLGQALAGTGLGAMYFSLFAAFGWHHLIPQELAFLGMAAVTALGLAFAVSFEAESTAVLAMVGGFLTPFMLSTGQDAQVSVFSYLLILNVGVLGAAAFRKWSRLELLAFCGTVFTWIAWFGQYYSPEKFTATAVLLTIYFLLFALLGVWHSIVQRKPPKAPDFVLILGTPCLYFAALYAITLRNYAVWQGLFAMALAGFYGVLGGVARVRHPQGEATMGALWGLAAAFLTLAVPLHFTGHWVAILWAVESLILVRMGFRLLEPRLREAGGLLLLGVLMCLAWYGMRTLHDPSRFSTEFGFRAIEVVGGAGESGAAGGAVPAGSALAPPVASVVVRAAPQWSWLSLFNGRSLSYVATIVVMALMARDYRRHALQRTANALSEAAPPGDTTGADSAGAAIPAIDLARRQPPPPLADNVFLLLVIAAPVILLAMVMLEAFVAGRAHQWLGATYLLPASVAMGAVAAGYVMLSSLLGERRLINAALAAFALLFVLQGLSIVTGLLNAEPGLPAGGWRGVWVVPVFNPRGIGLMATLAAVLLSGWVVRGERALTASGEPADSLAGDFTTQISSCAHLVWGGLLVVEIYAQSVIHQWLRPEAPLALFLTLGAISAAAIGLWTARQRPNRLSDASVCWLGVLAVGAALSLLVTLAAFRTHWRTGSEWWTWPIINPRGLSLLAVISAALALRWDARRRPAASPQGLFEFDAATYASLAGFVAYGAAFAALTAGTYAQGLVHDWGTVTSLAVTGTWTVFALATLAGGIVTRSATLRQLALGLLALTTGKVFLYDVWYLDKGIRTIAFMGLGAALMGVSWLYRRYRDEIREWMQAGGDSPPDTASPRPEGGLPLSEDRPAPWPQAPSSLDASPPQEHLAER